MRSSMVGGLDGWYIITWVAEPLDLVAEPLDLAVEVDLLQVFFLSLHEHRILIDELLLFMWDGMLAVEVRTRTWWSVEVMV